MTDGQRNMRLTTQVERQLCDFAHGSRYWSEGGVITDLDGTAVHEVDGRIYIPKPVELGLKRQTEMGRPFVLNSLRFPLSILRTFGREWYNVSNAPIPTISLNGSLLGYVTKTDEDEMAFDEVEAHPLTAQEIDEVLDGVNRMLGAGIKDLLLFHYPRDWREGEIIWTPVPDRVTHVKEKYSSASSVTAVEVPTLREQMHSRDVCMIFLLIDAPSEQLMAYQHTERSNFITHEKVDKLFGVQRMAAHLGIQLTESVGAGDTEMDCFLEAMGLAVHVGTRDLEYHGIRETIKLPDSNSLGDLLFRLAELKNEARVAC